MPNERAPQHRPHAVVSGASSGIGLAITQALVAAGWRVTGLSRRPPEGWRDAAFMHAALDLADGPATTAQARALATAPGGVQALVHAAGVLRVARLGALDPAEGESMWRLHVAAAERLADALLPPMAEAGFGRAVLVGSRVSGGKAGRSQYAAGKAALVALARSWAAELVTQGVTVNVVSPAATDTAMLADPARQGSAPVPPPMGRLIRADEVAALVAYLLSPPAAPITGQEIRVCGGSSLER